MEDLYLSSVNGAGRGEAGRVGGAGGGRGGGPGAEQILAWVDLVFHQLRQNKVTDESAVCGGCAAFLLWRRTRTLMMRNNLLLTPHPAISAATQTTAIHAPQCCTVAEHCLVRCSTVELCTAV